jgi:hypothetical protein
MDTYTVTVMHGISTSSQNGATISNLIHEMDRHKVLMFLSSPPNCKHPFRHESELMRWQESVCKARGGHSLEDIKNQVQKYIGWEKNKIQKTIIYRTTKINIGD